MSLLHSDSGLQEYDNFGNLTKWWKTTLKQLRYENVDNNSLKEENARLGETKKLQRMKWSWWNHHVGLYWLGVSHLKLDENKNLIMLT